MSEKKLTLKETAAQCIFPRLDVELYFKDPAEQARIKELVQEGAGGFCVFKGNKKMVSRAVSELQDLAEIPLLFAADFENGLPMRLADGTSFAHAMALGKTDVETVYQTAKAIAKEAKQIGILWNLAPVCDVNSNPDNPIINIRAFGEDTEIVSILSEAYIKGTQDENMLACAKHFPGHGDTDIDSHLSMPVLKHSADKIRSVDLVPFKNASGKGVMSVMTGHLAVEAFDSADTPASLSENIINILRKEINFKGLVITDGLDMKAITDRYSPGEAAVKAVKAGNNIALLPEDPRLALEEITKAAENDPEIHRKVIDSMELIIQNKRWCGLFNRRMPSITETQYDDMEHEKFSFASAFRAVEIIDNKGIIPLKESDRIASFAVLQDENIEPASFFFKLFAQAMENEVDFAFIDSSLGGADLQAMKSSIEQAEIVIFALFHRAKAYSGTVKTEKNINDVIKKLSEGKKTAAVLLGNPYLKDVIEADSYIRTFSNSIPSIAASVLKLAGREAF